MTEDAAGNVWAGTSGGLLVRIANGVVTDETPHTTGAPLSIRCLRGTDDGSLWIGYADEGVGRLKDGRFFHLSVLQNFPDENVSQIVADGDGWLWFGGDHGIFKARQTELDRLIAGQAVDVNYVRYGQSESLFSLEANCGDSPGAIRTADGRIWIPMRTALAIADPSRAREDRLPAPLLIKRVTVDDQTVASYGGDVPARNGFDLGERRAELQLPAGYHRLKFEFTALNFSAPENVRFRYKLDGFDNEWMDGGTQRVVSYSRLAAGHYLFRLTSCNSSGVWSEKQTTFAFTVAPFFWQTWWFEVAALAVFTSVVVAIVRYISFRRLRSRLQRLEQQAALDRERARIARDIHDDLGGRLTEVELLLESVNRTPREKWNGQMHRLSATVRQAGESLDEIVWAV
ncbi:MAG TPA: triple tyrosine motif-containing protein, partial [Candidatus Dormibacteraeota bacterium]|nr:triple tyrosine motif-containing protein [Candidatus Dormibacteraeota bacterium]